MNQIPNIEETHNTEVEDTTAEKLAHKIAKLFDDGFTTPTFGQVEKIEVLLHQQLQKAREEAVTRAMDEMLEYTHLGEQFIDGVRTLIEAREI